MPELPEVETVRRGLVPAMEGRVVTRVTLNRPDLRWPLPPRMAGRMTGARVAALRRRSKYLLADLDTGETLIWHLGMSGRVLVSDAAGDATLAPFALGQVAAQRHDHVVFDLSGGMRVTFNDPRRFGAMDLTPTAELDRHRLLARIGPEPLGNGFGAAHLSAALAGRRMPVKAALLDQRIVAGLGNIYVCEALHRAGISPRRAAGRIGATRIAVLSAAIRDVLIEAIEAGGSSLRDYRRTDGKLGYFQHRFAVYGREGQACSRPGCDRTVARLVQAGRSSFYCPGCQR